MSEQLKSKSVTTQQILKHDPSLLGEFDPNLREEFTLNIFWKAAGKQVARVYSMDETFVYLFDDEGRVVWLDFASKYDAWDRNGEWEITK